MRRYRIEILDPRYDTIINIVSVDADIFMVDDAHVTVAFYVENSDSCMTPVAMIPFQYVVSILPDFAIEGCDSE